MVGYDDYGILFLVGNGRKPLIHTIIGHVDLLGLDAVTTHDILLRKLRDRHDALGLAGILREELLVMPQMDSWHIFREMLEVKVMKLSYLCNIRTKTQVAVGREKQVGLNLLQRLFHRKLEKPDEQEGMPGLGK